MSRRRLLCLLWLWFALGAFGASCGSSYGVDGAEIVPVEAGDAQDDGAMGRPDADSHTEEASLPGNGCEGDAGVDQENLPYEERIVLTPEKTLGQSFIVSRDGALARIDVLVQMCSYTPLPEDRLRVDVFDGVDRIARAESSLREPTSMCASVTADLLPFEFTRCVPLKAQRLYRYTLSAVTTASRFEAEIGLNHQNTYAHGAASESGTARAMDDHVFRILLR